MAGLIKRLESGPGSRELSDECLLAVGWTLGQDPHGGDVWLMPPMNVFVPPIIRPDPSRNVQDAIDWMVPNGWHVGFLATGDKDMGVNNMNRYPRCSVTPNLNNDDGWKRGIAVCQKAPTPALALSAASLKAHAAMKESDG